MKTLLVLVIFVASAAVSRSQIVLYFTSSPTSWVGQGETIAVVSGQNGWNASASDHIYGSGVNIVEFYFQHPSPYTWWNLQIKAPNSFEVGMTYEAQRFGFETYPKGGFDLSGDGRGYNQLNATFTVREFVRGPDGHIQNVAIDFFQRSATNFGEWESGALRFNSSVPIAGFTAVPEPSTNILMAIGLAGVVWWACWPRRTA